MMKNILFVITTLLTIVACNKKSSQSDPNEIIVPYSDNEKLTFKKRTKYEYYDSLSYHYRNGVIFKKGKISKEAKQFGIWKLYSIDGTLREIREWFIIDSISRINRVWFLNEKGDTLAWRGQDSIFKQKEFIHDTLKVRATDYNTFVFNKDTISLNEPIRGVAFCNSRRIRDYNSQIRVFLHSESKDFNSPFPNDSVIRHEYFENLKIDRINQKWFPHIESDRYGHVAVFGTWFENPGKKLLRGYMEEYSYGPFDEEWDSITAKVYFEKTIFVKDSVN